MDDLDFDLGDPAAIGDDVVDALAGPAGAVAADANLLDIDLGPAIDVACLGVDPDEDLLGLDLGAPGAVGDEVQACVAATLSPLELAWNARVRRSGDQVGSGDQTVWTHPNTYLMDAAVRKAFQYKRPSLQKTPKGQSVDIEHWHRELEGLCTVAALAQAHLVDQAKSALTEIRESCEDGAVLGIAGCVCRYWDGTPSFHYFGNFPTLAKTARYVK